MTRRIRNTVKTTIRKRRTVYEMIYARLQQLGVLNDWGQANCHYMKFKSDGFMDLVVEVIGPDELSIAHYGMQNGDLMADPEMEIKVYPDQKSAEAMSYRNDYVGYSSRSYQSPGFVNPKAKRENNEFLNEWLKRAIEQQGFKPSQFSR